MIKGYWIPILHSHLPFIKHPKYENFLEEHWLFEAITECYIPLLRRLKKLEEDKEILIKCEIHRAGFKED